MSPQVIAAVTAAVAACLVATMSAVFQLRRERALKALEAEIRARERAWEAERDQRNAVRDSCVRACQSLQRFRDTIALLQGSSGAMLSQLARQRLEAARDAVLLTYEEAFVHLPEHERLLAHSAKNAVLELCARIDAGSALRHEMLKLNAADVEELAHWRAALAETQQMLLIASLSSTISSPPSRLKPHVTTTEDPRRER